MWKILNNTPSISIMSLSSHTICYWFKAPNTGYTYLQIPWESIWKPTFTKHNIVFAVSLILYNTHLLKHHLNFTDATLARNPKVGGRFYFIPDDTPTQNTFQFMEPFLELRGYSLSTIKFPFRLVYSLLLMSELIVKALSPLVTINLPAESYSVKYINMNISFSGQRAREELGFKPIFTPEVAKQRCLLYYKHMKL